MINLAPGSSFEYSRINMQDFVNGNYTDENALFKLNPAYRPYYDLTRGQALQYIATLTPSIYGGHTDMITEFSNRKITEYVDTETIRWSLKGTNRLKITSVENLNPDNPTPGIGRSEVFMKFSHGLWVAGDTIYPAKHPSIEFSIMGKSADDDTGTIYAMIMKTRNEYEYCEPHLLEVNEEWCKRGANHSEGSDEYGSSMITGGPSIITYQTKLGSYSMSHEFSDKSVHAAIRIRAKNPANQYVRDFPDQVILVEEGEFINKTRYQRSQSLFWGRDAGESLMDSTTGLHRRTCAGQLEYYEDGNHLEYDEYTMSIEWLKKELEAFFYNKVKPENARIKFKCGLELLSIINRALTKEYSVKPVQKPYSDFIKDGKAFPGSSQPGKHLTEPQFMGFDMYPYGVVEFEHYPILDDVELNGGFVHPVSGKPLTSYWGFADDYGLGATNNLKHFILKDSEYFNYICGTYSPVGAISNDNKRGFVSVHSRRSYKLVYSISEGIAMMDTKRTIFLHPAVKK